MTKSVNNKDVQETSKDIEEQPAAHGAYQRIFAMLIAGEFPSGNPVREATLAQQLGFSRNAVREALNRLVDMDVLEYTPYCGYRLLPYTMRDMLEWSQYRLAVEPVALELFLESTSWRARESIFQEMEAILKQESAFIEKNDLKGVVRSDLCFHMKIVESSGNRRLAGNYLLCSLPFLANISQQGPDGLVSAESVLCVDNLMMHELQQRTNQFHLRLLNEMHYGESTKAVQLIKDHIALSIRSIRDFFVHQALEKLPLGNQQNADSISNVVSLLFKRDK